MMLKSVLLIVSMAILIPSISIAAPAVNTEDAPAGLVTMDEFNGRNALTAAEMKVMKAEEKRQLRMERRMARVEKFMDSKLGQKLLGGINDPVDRFFWYWIIAWGVGLLLIVLATAGTSAGTFGIIGILATLAWLAGAVSLIVWLVKKFS